MRYASKDNLDQKIFKNISWERCVLEATIQLERALGCAPMPIFASDKLRLTLRCLIPSDRSLLLCVYTPVVRKERKELETFSGDGICVFAGAPQQRKERCRKLVFGEDSPTFY